MARSVVEIGQEILDAEAARVAAEREAQAQADAQRVGPGLIDLLTTVVARLAAIEQRQITLENAWMATRVRRPVRDSTGQVLYVVDELAPPAVAQPDDGST